MPRRLCRAPSAAPILLAACGAMIGIAATQGCSGDGGGGGGGSGFDVSLISTTPPAGGDLVWMADAGGAGDLQIVELLARDFTQSFDRYTIEICFDPLVVELMGATSQDLLDRCAGVPALDAWTEIDCSTTPGARALLISEAVTGVFPASCTLTGTPALWRFTLRALGPGSSPLTFVPFNADPDNPEGSVFLEDDSPPVPLVIQFFDTGTTIEVTS